MSLKSVLEAHFLAKIALSTVDDELPQWALFNEDDHATWGRKHTLQLLKERDKLLDPTFLCMIN